MTSLLLPLRSLRHFQHNQSYSSLSSSPSPVLAVLFNKLVSKQQQRTFLSTNNNNNNNNNSNNSNNSSSLSNFSSSLLLPSPDFSNNTNSNNNSNEVNNNPKRRFSSSHFGFAIVPERSAFVIERFGRYLRILSPGLHFLIPVIDSISYIHSLKEETIPIHRQAAITKDNVRNN